MGNNYLSNLDDNQQQEIEEDVIKIKEKTVNSVTTELNDKFNTIAILAIVCVLCLVAMLFMHFFLWVFSISLIALLYFMGTIYFIPIKEKDNAVFNLKKSMEDMGVPKGNVVEYLNTHLLDFNEEIMQLFIKIIMYKVTSFGGTNNADSK